MCKVSSSLNSKTFNYLIGIVFLLFTAGLSLYHLSVPSIWVDEAYTWLFSQLPWVKLFEVARIDGVNPPLYYMGVKLLTSFVAADEVGLRALSTIANLAALIGVLILGYRIGGRPGMVISGWFWTFHPMVLWYARDARPYALASAFAVFLVVAFVQRTNRSRSSIWLITTMMLMSLGMLTHYFFFILVAALTTYRIFHLRDRPDLFREWSIMLLVAFIPLLFWIAWYLQQTETSLGIGWIQAPGLLDIPKTLWNLLSGYGGVLSLPSVLFGLVGLVLVTLALSHFNRNSLALFAFVFGIVIPLLTVWVISQRRPVYVDRYFIILLPFVVILLSKGASNVEEWTRNHTLIFQRSPLQSLLLITLFAIGFWSAVHVHLDGKFWHEDWRGLVGHLQNQALKGDEIWLMEPEAQLPMSFYRSITINEIISEDPPLCVAPCWWVLRQPYTTTHAFTQSVDSPDRPWIPELPVGCIHLDRWDSPTGIALWRVRCDS